MRSSMLSGRQKTLIHLTYTWLTDSINSTYDCTTVVLLLSGLGFKLQRASNHHRSLLAKIMKNKGSRLYHHAAASHYDTTVVLHL